MRQSVCRWCFEAIHSVQTQNTPDRVKWEWRHAKPEHWNKWGSHFCDVLVASW